MLRCYGIRVFLTSCICSAGQIGEDCSGSLGKLNLSYSATVNPDQDTRVVGSGELALTFPAGALGGSFLISVAGMTPLCCR